MHGIPLPVHGVSRGSKSMSKRANSRGAKFGLVSKLVLCMHPCSLTLATLLTEQRCVHGILLPVHGVSKGSTSMSKRAN